MDVDAGPGVDRSQLRLPRTESTSSATTSTTTPHKTFFGTHEGLERSGHRQRDPARQRGQEADRGALHHAQAVGAPGLTSGRATTLVNTLADVFLANDFELKPLAWPRAILNDPEFYSTTAKQGPRATAHRLGGGGSATTRGIPFDGDGGSACPGRRVDRGSRSTDRRTSPDGSRTPIGSTPARLSGRSDFARDRLLGGIDGSAIWLALAAFNRTTQKTNAVLAASDFLGADPAVGRLSGRWRTPSPPRPTPTTGCATCC